CHRGRTGVRLGDLATVGADDGDTAECQGPCTRVCEGYVLRLAGGAHLDLSKIQACGGQSNGCGPRIHREGGGLRSTVEGRRDGGDHLTGDCGGGRVEGGARGARHHRYARRHLHHRV